MIVNLQGEKCYFNPNKNIIEKYSFKDDYNYKKYQEYFNEIKKIYYSINYYCEYVIEFSKKLEDSNFVYLISKKWLDEWRLYSNYDNIKDKFLDKDKMEVKNIINELINYFEENENRKKKLSPIILINKKEEIESFLKKDSLVLVNSSFEYEFKQGANFLNYQKIGDIIYFEHDEEKKFKLNKNIIISNGNNYLKNSIEDLKQLIKIYCFQKEIKDLIKNESKNIINYNTNINDGIFINNKIIKKYKNYFFYNELNEFLNNNFFLNDINGNNNILNYYELNENLISKIIEKLPESYKYKINDKKSEEQLKFDDIYENIKISEQDKFSKI